MIAKLLTPAESRLRFGEDHHYNPLEILEIAEKVNEIIQWVNETQMGIEAEVLPEADIEEELEMVDDEAAADAGLSDLQMGLQNMQTETVTPEAGPIKELEVTADPKEEPSKDPEVTADPEKEMKDADLIDNVKKDETIITKKPVATWDKAKAKK